MVSFAREQMNEGKSARRRPGSRLCAHAPGHLTALAMIIGMVPWLSGWAKAASRTPRSAAVIGAAIRHVRHAFSFVPCVFSIIHDAGAPQAAWRVRGTAHGLKLRVL